MLFFNEHLKMVELNEHQRKIIRRDKIKIIRESNVIYNRYVNNN